MPQQKSQFITHTFAGGWATDFGPTFYGSPDQGGQFKIPYLTTAKNIVYEFDGGPRKAPGTTVLNASSLGASTDVMGIFDYWKQGTSGSPSQRRIVHAGENIYQDAGSGTFSSLFSGMTEGAIPQYSTFKDLMITGNDSTADVPKSWDGSTAQNLAGTPPRFSFSISHRGRQWAAGNYSAPSRLYYSVADNPEDWAGAGSGSIDIDVGDGDMITGLLSWKSELFIFKGPNKLSIHRLTGSSSSDFVRTPWVTGISAAWQNSIFPMGDDFGFISPRGTVHSLKATSNYGDYNQTYLSYPINTFCREELNHNRSRYWWAATDSLHGYTLITVTRSGQTSNDRVLMLDWRFMAQGEQWPRWSLWDFGSFASLAHCIDTNNRPRIFAGAYDGYVYKMDQTTRTHNNTSINYNWATPFLSYGGEYYLKVINAISLGIAPKNGNPITVGWTRDDNAQQTTTISQSSGAALDAFILDTDVLGGSSFVPRFTELETGGEFRAIQYELTENALDSDVEIHNLGASLTFSGYSTENSF